jgi:sigma-B regulation protein RsbU (phosphoserine phosphatase)
MGKGVRAKFYAFSFLSYVRGTLHAMLSESDSPAELLHRVNHLLIGDDVMEETFASLLLINWDPDAHTLTYANAGHCRPVLVRPNGAEIIAHSDLILGLEPDASFTDTTIDLPADSALVLYTDGLMEQRLPSGDTLGEDGVLDMASAARDDSDPVRSMLDDALSRTDADAFDDDILIFWLEHEA